MWGVAGRCIFGGYAFCGAEPDGVFRSRGCRQGGQTRPGSVFTGGAAVLGPRGRVISGGEGTEGESL